MSYPEKTVCYCFAFLVFLWMAREPQIVPGWGNLFAKGMLSDATAAMIVACLLFVLPAQKPDFSASGAGKFVPRILDWDCAKELPWGIIILLGGGFALASAFTASGLSVILGNQG